MPPPRPQPRKPVGKQHTTGVSPVSARERASSPANRQLHFPSSPPQSTVDDPPAVRRKMDRRNPLRTRRLPRTFHRPLSPPQPTHPRPIRPLRPRLRLRKTRPPRRRRLQRLQRRIRLRRRLETKPLRLEIQMPGQIQRPHRSRPPALPISRTRQLPPNHQGVSQNTLLLRVCRLKNDDA